MIADEELLVSTMTGEETGRTWLETCEKLVTIDDESETVEGDCGFALASLSSLEEGVDDFVAGTRVLTTVASPSAIVSGALSLFSFISPTVSFTIATAS